MPLDVVILGSPGAGKGTQAERIAADAGIPHIATGDLVRAEIAAGTPFGRQVQAYNDRGELVPDEVMVARVRQRLEEPDTKDGFVLDGFPRTLRQAEALDAALEELDRAISVVLDFQLPEEVAEERLLGRALESGRTDDSPELIRRRIQTMRVPGELVAYYRARGNLVGIHADRPVDEVYGEIQNVLESVPAG